MRVAMKVQRVQEVSKMPQSSGMDSKLFNCHYIDLNYSLKLSI